MLTAEEREALFALAYKLSATSLESLPIMDLIHAGRELGIEVPADFETPLNKEYTAYRSAKWALTHPRG